MARITVDEAKAWIDQAKLPISSLDDDLLLQLETEVLAQLSPIYDVTTWTDEVTTPKTVRVIIAKMYASWLYNRFYSEDQEELNDYAQHLNDNAKFVLKEIIDGNLDVIDDDGDVVAPNNPQVPSFYPTNASSNLKPTLADPSLGGPYFSMGLRF